MAKQYLRCSLRSFLSSARAIALPVTFMILFVSLTLLISVTYYFSITQINAKTQEFKSAGGEQEMLSFQKVTDFVAWSPGSYQIYDFGDFGGTFNVTPTARVLTLNLTDNHYFDNQVFNGSVGKVSYELVPSEKLDNLFLKGDNRAIINQSSSTMTQLYISRETTGYEVTLTYRPIASSVVSDTSGVKPVNELKIYVVSFGSSQNISRLGEFRVKITCTDVTTNTQTYDFSSPLSSLTVSADLDGTSGHVALPISSNDRGATVNLEIVTCSLKIEDVGW